MPLTTTSTLARRARHSTAGSLRSIGPLGSAAALHHHRQQTRDFRFGRLWSSLDPEFHRDICRRHSSRYKYTDSLNKRSSWDKHSLSEDVKQVVNSYWHPNCKGRRSGERYGDLHASAKTPDNPEGVRPGQNIEDVERAPLEHLLFGGKKGQRARKKARAAAFQNTAAAVSKDADSEYVVDPITNRKVFNKILDNTYSPSSDGIDMPTPKPYEPQFTPFKAPEVKDTQDPIFYDGPPPEAELKLYNQLKIDAHPWDSVSQSSGQEAKLSGQKPAAVGHDTAHGSGLLGALGSEHKDVLWHHHEGIASSSGVSTAASWTSRPRIPEYSDLHKYRTPIKSDEPSTNESAKQDYEDLPKYTAVRYQEPDGKPLAPEPTQKYEDLDNYSAVRAHEPDGKYKLEQEPESQAEQQELSKYGAFRSHEPDGKYAASHVKPQPGTAGQESTPEYEDLDKYGAVRSHEPDGKYRVEESVQKYDDLDKYGAVRAHEPDGKYKVVEPAQKYDDLDKYGAVRAHEPDGMYKLAQETPVDPEELSKYIAFRSHEPDGKYAASYLEQPEPAELAEYSKPFLSHEPDGMYAASHVEPKRDEAELAQYTAFRSHEPDGKYAVNHVEPKRDAAELASYKAVRSHEPDGKYAASYVEPKPDTAELGAYVPFRSHEPDGKYAANQTTPTVDAAESRQYQAFRSHEPDGKYAAEAQSATETPDLGNHEAFGYDDSETRPTSETQPSKATSQSSASGLSQNGYYPAELKKYQPLRWNEPDGKPGDVQEFGHTLFEYDLKGETSSEAKVQKTPYRKMVEDLMAQPTAESEQPSSGHQSKPNAGAASSGDAGTQPPAAAPQPTSNPAEPSLYKVLVYDPTMQCVEAAETTSIVPDTATPLSPAEVLLRISNPAKFFPHFAPLQAQGFEIVSGSGDVLIFRKVREAAATEAPKSEPVSSKTTESAAATKPVNPIDMTGGRRDYTVAAGRFASPTGFVNYDLPSPRVVRPTEVSREEPAVSGQKVESEDKPAKKGVTKRVAVGAAWLAGVSYSLGVVSEYF